MAESSWSYNAWMHALLAAGTDTDVKHPVRDPSAYSPDDESQQHDSAGDRLDDAPTVDSLPGPGSTVPLEGAATVGAAEGAQRPAPCRYAQWKGHVVVPLERFRATLGRVRRNAIIGSFATGCAPECTLPEVMDIPCDFHWKVDNKPSAWRFCQKQGFTTGHFFVDASDFTANCGRGVCANHGLINCSALTGQQLDFVLAGISCKAYSTARTGRREGTLTHPEAMLLHEFVRVLTLFRPKKACLENVLGFLFPDSKGSDTTPLLRFIQLLQEHLPEYVVTCYITNAKAFLCLERRRCWIVATSREAGGLQSAQLQTRLIQEPLHKQYSKNDVQEH